MVVMERGKDGEVARALFWIMTAIPFVLLSVLYALLPNNADVL